MKYRLVLQQGKIIFDCYISSPSREGACNLAQRKFLKSNLILCYIADKKYSECEIRR